MRYPTMVVWGISIQIAVIGFELHSNRNSIGIELFLKTLFFCFGYMGLEGTCHLGGQVVLLWGKDDFQSMHCASIDFILVQPRMSKFIS